MPSTIRSEAERELDLRIIIVIERTGDDDGRRGRETHPAR